MFFLYQNELFFSITLKNKTKMHLLLNKDKMQANSNIILKLKFDFLKYLFYFCLLVQVHKKTTSFQQP